MAVFMFDFCMFWSTRKKACFCMLFWDLVFWGNGLRILLCQALAAGWGMVLSYCATESRWALAVCPQVARCICAMKNCSCSFKNCNCSFLENCSCSFLETAKTLVKSHFWGVAVENCSCSFPKTAVAVYKTATAVCTNASVGLKSMLPFWICSWFVLGVVSIEQWIRFATWYRIASNLQTNQSAILQTWTNTNMNSALLTVLVHYTLVQYSTVNPLLIGSHKYGLAVHRWEE